LLQMSLEGRHLGRYRLLEPLGSGGMSVVYKGLDTSLHREVAVKVLHPHLSRQHEARARLAREARAVARLQHPNILEVFDFADPASEEAFLVTELVRGVTLKVFAEQEKLWPPELAAMVVEQLASALGHAHEAGVIHRDLKPENVMVRDDGVLKLMDFGIARVLDPGERMTVTGALVGSPAYMAPEVIDGQPATAESDVFSLGTLLYWLCTGALPFQAASTQATLKRILDGSYDDPRGPCPALSDGLAGIIARCLEREPSRRYPSARELATALGTELEALGFSDVEAVLSSFFADPPGGREETRERLVVALIAAADAEAAAGRIPRALGRLNQLLALSPEDARVAELGQRLRAGERRQRRVRHFRSAALATAAVVAAVLFGRSVVTRAPPPEPSPAQVLAPAAAAAVPTAPATARPPAPPEADTGGAAPAATPETPAVTSDQRPAVRPAPVRYQILVRPYGSLQVDDGKRSTEELAVHAISLLPGHHLLRVSCQWCEDQVIPLDVVPGPPQTLAIPARLKPAQLRFAFDPPAARVRIGDVTRTAAESMGHPFDIPSPRAPTRFLHRVEYEVSLPGYQPLRSAVDVLPGASRTLTGKLVAE
jgi:serine/threonine-protein kinase